MIRREAAKMKKILCLFALLLMGGSALFSISPLRESFAIRNNSSSDVIVNAEFWLGPGCNTTSNIAWRQTISGVRLSIRDMSAVLRSNVVWPNEERDIIRYDAGFHHFDDMVAIPITVKLNAIFRSLEIIHNEGRGIITLEDLMGIELEKLTPWEGRIIYTLEIFDLDDEEHETP